MEEAQVKPNLRRRLGSFLRGDWGHGVRADSDGETGSKPSGDAPPAGIVGRDSIRSVVAPEAAIAEPSSKVEVQPQPTVPEENAIMSLATIVVDAEKGIEVAATDVLKFVSGAEAELKLAPAVVAGVATILGSVSAAATATEAAAAGGFTSITLDNAALAAIKAV